MALDQRLVPQLDVIELAKFVRLLRHQRLVVDYMYLNAAAILIYDYCLTLHLEIKLIWLSTWTYSKFLFLLIRYTGFGYAVLILYDQLSPGLSPEICRVTFPMSGWLLLSQMFFAEVILAIRTWAVWRRNKVIGILFAVLLPTGFVVRLSLANKFLKSIEYSSPLYPGFRGCFMTGAHKTLWTNYAVLTVVEAVVLTLMVISAFRSYKCGNSSELSHVIHREGILFYVYIFLITAANLVVTITFPTDMITLLVPLEDLLFLVLTSRIVLSIREVGGLGRQNELHTVYNESLALAIPLQAVSDENGQDGTAWAQSSCEYQSGGHWNEMSMP